MKDYLNQPIDSAALIFFRFATGMLLICELINGIFLGKITQYTSPAFHFSYLFTPFIRPLPHWGVLLQYVLVIIAAIHVSLGKFYRISSLLLFVTFTHLFLSEMSEYINHAYLYCLMLFWLMILPLGEKEVTSTHPRWMLWLILFHLGLAYFFAGVAKINADWLNGTPMDIFLSQREEQLFAFIYKQSWAPLLYSWGGVVFDLFIVFFLMIPRTRLLAFIAAGVFHLSNVFMFGLASFPWYCMVLTSLFFNPSWPRKLWGFNRLLSFESNLKMERFKLSTLSLFFLSIYIFTHLLLPFRHFLYPHSPNWSEEGHQFSWRMMLRTKGGNMSLIAEKENGQKFVIDPKRYLTPRQMQKMKGHPDMILQFAHFLKKEYETNGEKIKIFCYSQITLNHHLPQALIDPQVDLATVKRGLAPYSFILPGPAQSREFKNLAETK